MRKSKEADAQYMREYRARKKAATKTVAEQRQEVIGTLEDHIIDESIYDQDAPSYREGHEYSRQEIADNQEWCKEYLRKIGRF